MAKATAIIDTNIFIDLLRDYPPAIEWMRINSTLELAIPSLVRMELVLGARDKADQKRVIELINPFQITFPIESDAQWAMQQFEQFHLSHQVEIIDCFIAAMSARLQLPVYTRNAKDLSIFPGVMVHAPY
jgi:predicted nucleic acid-binding protein